MNEVHQGAIQLAVAYTLLGAFIFTVVAVCLSLVGLVRFQSKKQQSILFSLLIVEIVGVGVVYFYDLLSTAKVGESALKTATKIIERKIQENAVIFLHIPSEEKRSEARKLREQLRQFAYVVPEIRNTGENTPNNNEIRFFYPHQEDKAKVLLKHISKFGLKNVVVKCIRGYEGTAQTDTIEVWFGKRGG